MNSNSYAAIDIEKVLAGGQLPALPQSAVPILELSQDPANGPPEFAVPIESDPGLASQVLRFVNSAYFGFAHEISSVRQSLVLVGVRTVKNFVLWSAIFSSIPDPKCGPFDLKRAWQDSLRRAIFARSVAKTKLRASETEEAFTAALLQDVAIPLLAKNATQVYSELFDARTEAGARLSELESRVLGWTHAEAGAIICRRWNLPKRIAAMVENHVKIDHCLKMAKDDPANAAVALSALLPSSTDLAWTERELFERCCEQTLPSRSPEITDLLDKTDTQFSELAPMLNFPLPDQTLTELYEGLPASSVASLAAF